ncbi:hypothetical protein L861_14680 [Litchfieldella anticariensis FP35 = DSM 16096]|uniref:T2SS protein K first SAM-like domain-containing protein n=1 Tax=Litchfieldella anticariensis (strain DSM 16096 / CECT 5854 / CIP 108499 / LMG 22089 / FP35) TaxID=1121939 RepID=S2KD96_LITA3|nr:type II secretion system protein GspK [Halomonas anticariensis]EPC00172.1 hypothetical protein L861_14680 [Halomonas anticariensis FP35 = DSM 16096]
MKGYRHIGTGHRQRGVALIIVLWIAALLAVMVANLMSAVRTGNQLDNHQLQHTRALMAAEAGVEMAAANFLRGNPQGWRPDGRLQELHFDDTAIEVRSYSDQGNVNINMASAELLEGLFMAVGVDHPLAARLADEVVDWRDPDQSPRPHGAEAEAYLAAGRHRLPPDRSFRSIADLRQVLSMSNAIFQKIEPLVTTSSGLEIPRSDLAAPAVKDALRRSGGIQIAGTPGRPSTVLTVVSRVAMPGGGWAGVVVTFQMVPTDGGWQQRPYRMLYRREF